MAPTLPIYLDHHATTPVDPRVLDAMDPVWRETYGNAASHTHAHGWRAEAVAELAREQIAAALGTGDPREVVFTSGATESNNLALQGAVGAHRGASAHVVTVVTEHSAVLDPCAALEADGVRVTRLPVDNDGLVDPGAIASAIADDTVLVSVMAANNEIGVLQPLDAIGRVCAERGVLLHTDAAQAFGREPLDTGALGIDLLSCTAHKLYGPKGVGALYVRRRHKRGGRLRLRPLMYGGGHEGGMRSGTLPVPLIAGFGRAVELAVAERDAENARLGALRDRLLAQLREAFPRLVLNGHPTRRLAHNLSVAIPGVAADALLPRVPGLAISTGSACSSAKPEPSHVLRAVGVPDAVLHGSLRIGVGRFTQQHEIDEAARQLTDAARQLLDERVEAGVGA